MSSISTTTENDALQLFGMISHSAIIWHSNNLPLRPHRYGLLCLTRPCVFLSLSSFIFIWTDMLLTHGLLHTTSRAAILSKLFPDPALQELAVSDRGINMRYISSMSRALNVWMLATRKDLHYIGDRKVSVRKMIGFPPSPTLLAPECLGIVCILGAWHLRRGTAKSLDLFLTRLSASVILRKIDLPLAL